MTLAETLPTFKAYRLARNDVCTSVEIKGNEGHMGVSNKKQFLFKFDFCALLMVVGRITRLGE